MRLYLINPGNPLVSMTHTEGSRWNRYSVWKPLSLLALAGVTPRDRNISIVDENRSSRVGGEGDRPDAVRRTGRTGGTRPVEDDV